MPLSMGKIICCIGNNIRLFQTNQKLDEFEEEDNRLKMPATVKNEMKITYFLHATANPRSSRTSLHFKKAITIFDWFFQELLG